MARLLLERGAAVGAVDKNKQTPLFLGKCKYGHEPVARLLLDRGAAVGAVDEYKQTAFLLGM